MLRQGESRDRLTTATMSIGSLALWVWFVCARAMQSIRARAHPALRTTWEVTGSEQGCVSHSRARNRYLLEARGVMPRRLLGEKHWDIARHPGRRMDPVDGPMPAAPWAITDVTPRMVKGKMPKTARKFGKNRARPVRWQAGRQPKVGAQKVEALGLAFVATVPASVPLGTQLVIFPGPVGVAAPSGVATNVVGWGCGGLRRLGAAG